MKFILAFWSVAFFTFSLSFAFADGFEIPSHSHEHKIGCGHDAVSHGDHMDYLHDSHYHAKHGSHFDDHGMHALESKRRTQASTNHAVAVGHSHRHGKGCGHKWVSHGSHKDYLHDGEYHTVHKDHYDVHGTPISN